MSTHSKKTQEEVRESIITMFNIDKLPEDRQEETIARIGEIIFQAVLIRILPLLEEEDLKEYERLIEMKVPPEELMDFFFEIIPDFLDIISEESENLRKEIAEMLGKIK